MSQVSQMSANGISQIQHTLQQRQEERKLKTMATDRLLYSGSVVKEGSCLAIVMAVGSNTQLS